MKSFLTDKYPDKIDSISEPEQSRSIKKLKEKLLAMLCFYLYEIKHFNTYGSPSSSLNLSGWKDRSRKEERRVEHHKF